MGILISIHLMLLFNRLATAAPLLHTLISIHLMLLFNLISSMNGSRFCSHFNTSNVTIQQIVQLLDLAFNLISIHLMLLFNEKGRKYLEDCYRNFNTSNVTIQLTIMLFLIMPLIYFNTSNVTIQPLSQSIAPLLKSISIHLMLLFNTTMLTIFALAFLFQYI